MKHLFRVLLAMALLGTGLLKIVGSYDGAAILPQPAYYVLAASEIVGAGLLFTKLGEFVLGLCLVFLVFGAVVTILLPEGRECGCLGFFPGLATQRTKLLVTAAMGILASVLLINGARGGCSHDA